MSEATGYERSVGDVTFRTLSSLDRTGADPGESDIHVWTAKSDLSDERLAQLERSLAADERERIARLRADSDRRQATASRGLLRHILAAYAGRSAEELRFGLGPAGKPELLDTPGHESLHFNATHSGSLVLVAISRLRPLGVDIERIRPIARWESVARRAFTDEEKRRIEELPAEDREAAFLTCWTRKEACVKAIGEGVWSAFGRFEVSVAPGEPAKVLSVDGAPALVTDWSLFHLKPAPGFVGALAVPGSGWRVLGGTLDSLEAEK